MKTLKQLFCLCLMTIFIQFNAADGQNRKQIDSTKTAKTANQLSEGEMAHFQQMKNDWANLGRFRDDNTKLESGVNTGNRVVFMGNSITEGWIESDPAFFSGRPYINRGISGQTTPQMLIRFRPDVINLKPKAVVILAGTNDIAGNTGPSSLEMIEDNLKSMVDLAKANGIAVILSSVLPAYDYSWNPGVQPAGKIAALNLWIKSYCSDNKIIYLDYYTQMVDKRQGLKSEYSEDGVHPNKKGYSLMEPLADDAITKALNQK